ncbi:hypothetical protein [Dechloromonas sp.]|nr:hypothetical protein [Dechloromonas sp.]
MLLRIVAYLVLLTALAGLIGSFPFLFELLPLGAISGAYWLFFRKPPAA